MNRILPTLAGLALIASPARAERLTLQQAQVEARARAPEAAELEVRLRGAEEIARAEQRVLRMNPIVSGGLASGALVGRPDERFWDLGLEPTLDVSGSWGPRGASASAARDVT